MVAGAVFGLCFYNFIVFFLYYKYKKYGDAPIPDVNYWGVILLFVLFGVYGVQFGDYPHYAEEVGEVYKDYFRYSGDSWQEGHRLGPLYNNLVVFCRGNYDMWRFVWFAVEFWGIGYILRNLHHNNYQALLIFACSAMFSVCAGRVSWGIAFYFFGMYAFLKTREIKYLLFVGLSFFAHKSMLALLVIMPLVLIKENKKLIILSCILVPILAGLFANILVGILQFSLVDESTAMYLERGYFDVERENVWGGSFLARVHHTFERLPLYYLVLTLIIGLFFRRIHLRSYAKRFCNLIVALFAISHVALLADIGSASLYFRFLFMLYIPIFIVIYLELGRYFLQKNGYRGYIIMLWLAFNFNYLQSIYYYSLGS